MRKEPDDLETSKRRDDYMKEANLSPYQTLEKMKLDKKREETAEALKVMGIIK